MLVLRRQPHLAFCGVLLTACGSNSGSVLDAAQATDAARSDANLDAATSDAPTTVPQHIIVNVAGLPTSASDRLGYVLMVQDGATAWRAVPMQAQFGIDINAAYYGVGIGCQGFRGSKRQTAIVYRAVAQSDHLTLQLPFECSQAAKSLVALTGEVLNFGYQPGIGRPTLRLSFREGQQTIGPIEPGAAAFVGMTSTPGISTLAITRSYQGVVDRIQLAREVELTQTGSAYFNFGDAVPAATAVQTFPPLPVGSYMRIAIALAQSASEQVFISELQSKTIGTTPTKLAFVAPGEMEGNETHVITGTALREGDFLELTRESKNAAIITMPPAVAPTATADRTPGTSSIRADWTLAADATEYRAMLQQTDDDGSCQFNGCLIELKATASPAWRAAAGPTWETPNLAGIFGFPSKFNATRPITITLGAYRDNGIAVGAGHATTWRGIQRTL